MAYKTEYLEHPITKEKREAPIGFSWTTLFFGFFPALIRGDWKWSLIMLVFACLTGPISWIVFPFIYNRIYYKESIREGFVHLQH